jgi:hypothetical protein
LHHLWFGGCLFFTRFITAGFFERFRCLLCRVGFCFCFCGCCFCGCDFICLCGCCGCFCCLCGCGIFGFVGAAWLVSPVYLDARLQAESEVAHVVERLVAGVERVQKAAAAAAVRRKGARGMGSEQRKAAARAEAAAQVVEWLVQSVAEQVGAAC